MNVPEVLKEIVFTLLPNSVSENHGLFSPPASLMTLKEFIRWARVEYFTPMAHTSS